MSTTYPTDNEDADTATATPQAASALDEMKLLARLKRWYKGALPTAQKWRESARDDFAMLDGHQWSDEDKAKLLNEGRMAITFNRLAPIHDAVIGIEINQRQDIVCKQRGLEDTAVAEVATALIEWAGDQCDAPAAHTDAFSDTLAAGMGWVEARVDDEGEIRYVEAQINAFEMVWDSQATCRRNLEGARFVFRAREMDIDAAREMFPGKSKSALDATWANGLGEDAERWNKPRRAYSEEAPKFEAADDDEGPDKVTIVEAQWRELQSYGEITHADGTVEEIGAGQVDKAMMRLSMLADMQGMPPPQGARKAKRWVVWQAFVGREILQPIEQLPTRGMLGYRAITGKYDRKDKVHYGIVRAASDPQRWANKWLLQGLNIMDKSAKDTLLYEQGAFGDTDAETVKSEWAQIGAVIETAPNAITGGKIQRQQGGNFPQGYYQVLELAYASIRDCTGVNQETLGLMTRDQAGVLENQRKQQTIAMLALYFENKRRALHDLGQLRLAYLTSGLFDPQTLADAVGPELLAPPDSKQADPNSPQSPPEPSPLQKLLADDGKAIRFDVKVDESPSSPNAKERNWAMMQPLVQMLLGRQDIGPEVYLAILENSPMPSAVFEKLKKALTAPNPTPEAQQKQAEQEEIAKRAAEAKIFLDQAKATQAMVAAQKDQVAAMLTALEPLVQPVQPPGMGGPEGASPMPAGGPMPEQMPPPDAMPMAPNGGMPLPQPM